MISLKIFWKKKRKLWNKIRDVMDPLAQLWKIVKDAQQSEDEAVKNSVNELLFYVEQIL